VIARLAQLGARHRRAVLAAALALLLAGELARRRLVVDAIPDLADAHVVLVAEWPDRAALAVAGAVTDRLTAALDGVPGATAVRGASRRGLGYVDVVFADAADVPRGRAAITARLAAVTAQLPPDVHVRVAPEASSTGWLLEYVLLAPAVRESLHDDGTRSLSLVTLRRFHDEVMRPRLAALAGVAEVASVGGETSEVLVELDPRALDAAALAVSDVSAALATRLGRPVATLAELGALPVTNGGGGDGGAHRLDALGALRLGRAMGGGMADLDGVLPVVGGVVIAQRGADPTAVAARARRALDKLRPQLPAGVELMVVYDRARLGHRVARTLAEALAEELIVVALVVALFLFDVRSAVVAVAALLVVLALTVVAMALGGVPATVMSLGGVAIALGLAVDAELVALEAAHRRREEAARPTRDATTSALVPAIVTTLGIAALTFAPAFAFTGETGRLLRPLVLTKTLIIGAALLVTVAIAPALRAWLDGGAVVPERRNPLMRSLERVYSPFVHFALARPIFTLVTVALLAASALPLVGRLGGELMPRLDEGDLLFMPTTSPDLPADTAADAMARQDRRLAQRPEVALVLGKLGRADTATDPAPCAMAETLVRLRPHDRWPLHPHRRWYASWAPPLVARALARLWPAEQPLTNAELIAELDGVAAEPGWSNAWTAPVRARLDMTATGVRTPVALRISARDPARLDQLGEVLRARLAHLPGTRSAVYEPLGGETWLDFAPDAAALARFGVDAGRVRALADLVLAGGRIGELTLDGRRLPLRLIADRTPRPLDEILRQATVRAAATTTPLLLGLLGRPRVTRAPALVRSEGGGAVAYVSIDLVSDDLAGYVARAQHEVDAAVAAGELTLGPGEQLEWSGSYRVWSAGRRRLALVAALVALSMLLLLYLQFRSWTEALIVLAAVPFALVGSVWTLYLLDYHLSAPVWVGLLSVVGLAMQTSVVMVVYIDEAFYARVRQGALRGREDIIAAHAEGTIRRLRPKLMTITTMAAALVPLLFADGAGAEIMKRVAAPMVGGLLSSALVTLEVLPVLYTLWRQQQLGRALRHGIPLTQLVGSGPGWARRHAKGEEP
jgi:Cu(I)/Ag(I) efflux system membrane protein CusA/SilA